MAGVTKNPDALFYLILFFFFEIFFIIIVSLIFLDILWVFLYIFTYW